MTLPDGGLNALLSLLFVLALIPAALWLLKRSPLGGQAQTKSAAMRQVASLPLSTTQRVVMVEVGSGIDRKWLVLGVTPQQITTLHSLPPQDSPSVDVHG
jgi:flagellar protein FliO/FliZ